ncbi:hypothetical protein DBR40_02905 [Pedobacter sp. KBW01]|nr:hypothetical protein DBR40_02905 [Pedobacter sp. KBW01]
MKDDYNSDEFSEGLRDAIKSDAKQYHYLLNALEFHRGLLPFEQLASYSVNPISKVKGHVSYESAIEKLESLELVRNTSEEVSLNEVRSNIKPNPRLAMAIQLVKDTLLLQYNDWARKLALTSYDASSFYSPFGNFCFAFVAPSYITTLTKWKEGKLLPGYIVADIMVNNNITVDHVEFFIKKVDILKAQKNTPNFLPFLIVDSVDPDALNSLKSNGIIVGFINQLFGDEYSSLMKSLINTVVNAGAILKTNPEQFIDLIKKLKSLVSGKTNNLRGDLFELAVGYYHSKMGCGTLDIGKLITYEHLLREMDVYAVYGNKIVVAECKGYNYPVTKSEIETWRDDKLSVIRNWILDQPSLNDKEIHFQYWSTGGFSDDSKVVITSMESTKKYKVEFYDPIKITQTSGLAKSKKFNDIMQDYFLKQS